MDYKIHLRIAVDAARAAGEVLLNEFNRPGGPRGSDGHCPADEKAEAIIREMLGREFAEFGMVGEELRSLDRPAGDKHQHIWVIDPNDGTSAFQKGWRGAAVSIALLRKGVPVLGVVFAYAARALLKASGSFRILASSGYAQEMPSTRSAPVPGLDPANVTGGRRP